MCSMGRSLGGGSTQAGELGPRGLDAFLGWTHGPSARAVRTSSPAAPREWDAASSSGSATDGLVVVLDTGADRPRLDRGPVGGRRAWSATRATRPSPTAAAEARRATRAAARLGQQRRRLPRPRPAQRPGRGRRATWCWPTCGSPSPGARSPYARFLAAGTPGAIVNVSSHQAQRAVPGALAVRRPRRPPIEGLTRCGGRRLRTERDPVQRRRPRLDRDRAVRRDAGRAARGRPPSWRGCTRSADPGRPDEVADVVACAAVGRRRRSSPVRCVPVDGGRAALGVDPEAR